ncbi:MAG: GNAT family N-acetyltransferase [Chloroflexia bacterium]|jgi:ribosomal protein S18 acetylase RimI-like enzyme|nr:GNAT family N-acetyltransferase [Chloroflexia bacterium]
MAITVRDYQGDEDYIRIRELLVQIYAIGGAPEDGTIGDLDWWRFTDNDPDAISTSRLWLKDGDALIGFAWLNGDRVDVMVHPHRHEIEEYIFEWAEEQHNDTAPGELVTLTAWANVTDEIRNEIFTRRGYKKQGSFLNYRNRSLADSLPEGPLADGYTIRDMQGDADIESRVAAHRSAFAPSKMTVEKHRAVMQSPTYRADLDIVAVAPEGSYAAFCIVWLDEANRLGVFEPVGCHADHQRRGLSSAVMAEGMRRARSLGAEVVCVLANGDDIASNRLYESLGFQLVDRNYEWKKTL